MKDGPECDFSFQDLYKAAHGKDQSKRFKKDFEDLPQEKINSFVKSWAKKAGWKTNDRLGSDNVVYTAFCPTNRKVK